MKLSLFRTVLLVAAPALATLSVSAQDHGHLYAGASAQTQGAPLIFPNGPDFAAAPGYVGYVKTLTFATNGTYNGYYQGNVTIAALATTEAHAGPDDFAASPGSFLQAAIVAVQGPPGGVFSFWNTTAGPTYHYTNGFTYTNLWRLTEADGSPGTDPYGHIHGRRFTATKPGVYKVSFKLTDTSTNGVGGGPIHTPSDVLDVYFQAGLSIASQVETNGVTVVTFGSVLGSDFTLECSTNLGNTNAWFPVDGPVAGTDNFIPFMDTSPAAAPRFYRVKGVKP